MTLGSDTPSLIASPSAEGLALFKRIVYAVLMSSYQMTSTEQADFAEYQDRDITPEQADDMLWQAEVMDYAEMIDEHEAYDEALAEAELDRAEDAYQDSRLGL